MPKDIPVRSLRRPEPTRNPVEVAKRFLDKKMCSYRGDYLCVDDCYVITITQHRPLPDNVDKFIRGLGFSSTGKLKYYYKKYSTINVNTEIPDPVFTDDIFRGDNTPMAPDPYSYTPDV